MPTAIGYVRQSRESQAAASPEAQRRAIEAFAASQGWRLIDVMADIGRSGYDPKAQRPALNELLAIVDGGAVDRVIVWKLDRLTRRGIKEALALVERIEAGGAALVSVTEPFDTSSALGQGIFALLLSLAQAESEKLSERVRGGKTVVRARGGWMGGPTPYGFDVVRVDRAGYAESRLVLDPARAPIVRGMVDDVLAGKSVRSLVVRLNAEGVRPTRGAEWNHASLLGLLRNPVLAGYLPDGHGGILRDGEGAPVVAGEPLVDASTWASLAERMTPRTGRRPQVASLLGGIIFCAGCRTTMGGETTGPHPSYRCNRNAGGRACPAAARIPMKDTDAYVTEALATELRRAVDDFVARGETDRGRLLDRVARWWALRDGSRADLAVQLVERDDIDASLARLREAFVAGDFGDDADQYRSLLGRLQVRREVLSVDMDAPVPTPATIGRPDFIDTLDFGTKRDLIRLLLRVDCVKAGRPGIKFIPERRLNISVLLDWPNLVAQADRWGAANDAVVEAEADTAGTV